MKSAVGKMAQIDLLHAGLPQTFNLYIYMYKIISVNFSKLNYNRIKYAYNLKLTELISPGVLFFLKIV